MFYCECDGIYHHNDEIPSTLRPFINHVFSSGTSAGKDFQSFNTKFKNVIKKLLPPGYSIHSWNKGRYYCSAVIKTNNDSYIYMSIPDVRFDYSYGWIRDILYRTMKHDKDWTGGTNRRTSLFTFTRDIASLY